MNHLEQIDILIVNAHGKPNSDYIKLLFLKIPKNIITDKFLLFSFQHQLTESKDAFQIQFPQKRFIDKAGLFTVWTFEVDIPKQK